MKKMLLRIPSQNRGICGTRFAPISTKNLMSPTFLGDSRTSRFLTVAFVTNLISPADGDVGSWKCLGL